MPSTAASLGQALFGLLAVLAVIGVMAYLAKRFQLPGQGQGALLKTITGLSVGTRERVVVVEVGETWLVLGVTAQNISTLHSMPKGEMPAAGTPVANLTNAAGAAGAFATLLARKLKKTGPNDAQ